MLIDAAVEFRPKVFGQRTCPPGGVGVWSCGLPPRLIGLAGCEVAEARVRSFSIVIVHPRADAYLAVAHRVERIEVGTLLLE